MGPRQRILAALGAEVSFAILPLLVVLLVLVDLRHGREFFAAPEWSFGASILFGQALVKFVAGLSIAGRAAAGPVALAVAVIVVFGLVPALLVLNMTLHALEVGDYPDLWKMWAQVLLFCGAVVAYLILGMVGEVWKEGRPKK